MTMTRTRSNRTPPARSVVRCAVYTRKSTEEGLEQEFNSLDAQRDAGEAYIKSQLHEGWELVPGSYDDGGFTGGNMERPALKRLMADIEAGKIDCVVVYKVDRLSRSLLDFARMMETFEKHHISFVSVTQQFNTAASMGRLILNVLLSFAQFEREMISERTRDKIAAARRKGKWVGGMPLLGYQVVDSKLVVDPDEASRVRQIFELYLKADGLLGVVEELKSRGWCTKRWTTRKGIERGGRPFDKTSLWNLLTNVTYIGKIQYKDEVHEGEHEALVTDEIWQRTQVKLQRHGRSRGSAVQNKFGALLKGILRCAPCSCAMTPTHVTRNQTKRYRYYVCSQAQKRGWHTCPSKSIPAAEIEQFVVDQIRGIGRHPKQIRETVAQAGEQAQLQLAELNTERRSLEREMAKWTSEVRGLVVHVGPGDADSPAVARLADLQERIRGAECRALEIRDQTQVLNQSRVDHQELTQAMSIFDPVWDSLTLREQARVVHLLVERVDYDGARGKVAVTFRPGGLSTLTARHSHQEDTR